MDKSIISLKVNGKSVKVSKLPLRKLNEVFKALDKLPSKFSNLDFQNATNDDFLAKLPDIIADILPEVAKLIAIGSDLSEDEVLDELGLAEAIEVLVAIYQVNDLSKVFEHAKKLLARKPADQK